MKSKLVLFFILISSYCIGQTISTGAKYREGSLTTICGVVAVVSFTDTIVSVDFGKSSPNQTFTALLISDNISYLDKVEDALSKDQKEICVTGKVKMYQRKPQIFIESPDQIRYSGSTDH